MIQKFPKWQVTYPGRDDDWNTALVDSRDKTWAFGVETLRGAGENGVGWHMQRLIYPPTSPEQMKKDVRNVVRATLLTRKR